MTDEDETMLLMSEVNNTLMVATTVSALPARSLSASEPPADDTLSLTNAEKLSLDPATAVGTEVSVTDGFVVSGHSDPLADGFYFADGTTVHAHPHYVKRLPFIGDGSDYETVATNDTLGGWNVGSDLGGYSGLDTSLDEFDNPIDQPFPWNFSVSSGNPGLTLTHPAVQQLAAPSTAQGGVFVSGGTQDGVYVDNGTLNGKIVFDPLGVSGLDPGNGGWYWNPDLHGGSWILTNTDGDEIYYANSAVATPDLATNWKNASDDSPASITVTSVTEGEIAAGIVISGVGGSIDSTYQVSGSLNGRNSYADLLGAASSVTWDPDHQRWSGNTALNFGNVAFPWQGTPDVAVTRDDVCSESSWEVVP